MEVAAAGTNTTLGVSMKKTLHITTVLGLVSVFLLSSCSPDLPSGPEPGFEANAVIGVSGLFHCSSESWSLKELLFSESLPAAGFQAIVSSACGAVEHQENIELMIANGAKVIVIETWDFPSLAEQLKKASASGTIIIALGWEPVQTQDVDMYIAYDNCRVGELQGTALLEGLDKKGVGPFNIELIAGTPEDRNSEPFFECAMKVLQPRIDSGDLVVPSGQLSREQVSTEGWLAKNVSARFDTILSGFYADGTPLHGILSPNDTLGRAAITSVEDAGMPIPVVTGQDSEVESINWIAEGKQYSTINKDTNTLVAEVIKVIQLLQQGKDAPINDTSTYDNGVKVVPAYLLTPMIVTADNLCSAYAAGTAAGDAAAAVC